MSRRGWLGLIAGVLLLLAVAGAGLWYWAGQGLYRPGEARRDLAAAPGPAPEPGPPGFWRVTPSVSLRHFEAGSGTDVLVVHGGPGLPPLRPWAAAAFTGDRVHWIFYQQRGCGESTRPFDRPPPGNMYRQMQAVDAALGLRAQIADIDRIRRLLGRDKLVLVGHSFGGLVAALYAAEFPEHVDRLVLVAPADLVVMPTRGPDIYRLVGERLPATMHDEYEAYHRRVFDFRTLFRQDERTLARTFAEFTRYYGVATAGTDVPAASVGATTSASGAPGASTQAGGPGEYEASAGGWVTLAQFVGLGRRHDWSEALRRVSAPVLVLHGDRDLVPVAQSRELAGYFPHARVQVIPGAGHFIFDERPRELADALVQFLAERS